MQESDILTLECAAEHPRSGLDGEQSAALHFSQRWNFFGRVGDSHSFVVRGAVRQALQGGLSCHSA